MAENLLSVREVAEKRGVTVWRIHQLIKAGTLQAEKYGNQYLVKIKDADALTIHGKPGRPKMVKSIELSCSQIDLPKHPLDWKEFEKALQSVFLGKTDGVKNTKSGFIIKYDFNKSLQREVVLSKTRDLFSESYRLGFDVGEFLLAFDDEQPQKIELEDSHKRKTA